MDFCCLDSLSPNFERRNSQNNQRDRSSSDGALGIRKKIRPERKGINENWRYPVDEKKETGISRTISNVETRQDSARLPEKHSGENNQSNLKRNNHSGGANNRNSAKRNTKHEDKKNNVEGEKSSKRSGNEGNYDELYEFFDDEVVQVFFRLRNQFVDLFVVQLLFYFFNHRRKHKICHSNLNVSSIARLKNII